MQRWSLGAAALALGVPRRHREQKTENHIMQNRATLTGYLGQNAILRTASNQTLYTVLSLATHRIWKDRTSGERKSMTTWHRCVVFGRLAKYAGTLRKGGLIQLEGEICMREYFPRVISDSTSSVKKTITEIRVFRILNLDRPAKAGRSGTPA